MNITELLDEVDLSDLGGTPRVAALNVLRRQSARLVRLQANRDTLVLLAREVGASYAEIADAAGRLATGDSARFLTDVARAIQSDDDARPSQAAASPSPARPATPPGVPHPAGERAAKRQSALAENIRKWIKGRGKNP